MLRREDVTSILNEYADIIGDEKMAEIGVKILEKDEPEPETSELDNLRSELESTKAAAEQEKKNYIDVMNKFIYQGIRPGDKPPEGPATAEPIEGVEKETDDVVEDDDFMSLMF